MFLDSYNMKWTLRNGTEEWEEEFEDICLMDFEVIYGNNIHEITYIELKLVSVIENDDI